MGWDSTIFGPYFVTGAFVSGTAAVIVAMYIFRKSYKLEEYITDKHFDMIGKLMVLVSLVYLYFNLNEYMVPAYKMKEMEAILIRDLFAGNHAMLFWSVQLLGLLVPIILLLFKKLRKPLPMLVIGIMILLGAWFKRYIIVVPTMEHPFLPIQNVPQNWKIYTPTLIEILVTLAPVIMALMIITILAKVVPIVSVSETLEHLEGVESAEGELKK